MRVVRNLLAAAALGGAALSLAAPAQAATTMAEFGVTSSDAIVTYTDKATGNGGTLTGAGKVQFDFLGSSLAGLPDLDVNFTLNAVSNMATEAFTIGGFQNLFQPGLDGSFSFTYAGLTSTMINGVMINTGDNILSAAFTGGQLNVIPGKSTGGILSAGSVNFSSKVLDFTNQTNGAFSFNLAGITSMGAGSAGNGIASFRATADAKFDSDSFNNSAIPEPGTWAVMILGFGMAGAALRRRRALGPILA